ncbi:Maf family nucleotide pyrophosphatase [Larkinella soli]|uniref:Maf family nucleotide pyrophosphatase n=1 Tax=Larkinella soli TaxID=1770527 RepID=UPI000FFC7E0E|nr:Maf family nucleotide pyrophosphatase [Larkinella soli]
MQLTRPLVLASHSPRRRQLLNELGFSFRTEVRPTEETFPESLPVAEVPSFLARQKADRFRPDLADRLVLCADTIVVVDDRILNKPADAVEAADMLRRLSGRAHQVMTGVCLLSAEATESFTDTAEVVFKPLDAEEIRYYIDQYRPFDKAGAYGVQEWIGMIGIERIEGSFYTIMGLPVHRVYEALRRYALPAAGPALRS